MFVDFESVLARRDGHKLAQRHYRPELFSVGYDFEDALALFNAYCDEIHVKLVPERFYETGPNGESHEALSAFLEEIGTLAPWQGPEYGMECELLKPPTPAWEARHPYWERERDAWRASI